MNREILLVKGKDSLVVEYNIFEGKRRNKKDSVLLASVYVTKYQVDRHYLVKVTSYNTSLSSEPVIGLIRSKYGISYKVYEKALRYAAEIARQKNLNMRDLTRMHKESSLEKSVNSE